MRSCTALPFTLQVKMGQNVEKLEFLQISDIYDPNPFDSIAHTMEDRSVDYGSDHEFSQP